MVVFGCDNKHDVFILYINILVGLQLLQLGVVFAEKCPVVAINGEPWQAHTAKQEQHD